MLSARHPRVRRRGFSLIEALAALGICAIVAALAYPSFVGQIRKARRAEAIEALSRLQLMQEAWRANQPRYGTLAEIRFEPRTRSGLYRVSVADVASDGYVGLAEADAAQAADAACRFMRLRVAGGHASHASGRDAGVSNADAANRRCWNQ